MPGLTSRGSRLACCCGLLPWLLAGPASAHTTWSNGIPVPDWVSKACCGPSDAHRLGPDQVHRLPEGYRIDGYPGEIYDAQVLPSEDGDFWAFYSVYIDAAGQKGFSSVFCFFAPSLG